MSEVYIARADRLAARAVAGEMVILKADDSSLYVLNGVGTAVWQAADGGTLLSGIVDDVCREYEIDRETALHDVTMFVDALVSHGVMRTSPTAMVGDDIPPVGREGVNG
jgi:hypothetical protein